MNIQIYSIFYNRIVTQDLYETAGFSLGDKVTHRFKAYGEGEVVGMRYEGPDNWGREIFIAEVKWQNKCVQTLPKSLLKKKAV